MDVTGLPREARASQDKLRTFKDGQPEMLHNEHLLEGPPRNLVAPYCAIPRDYLSDTPLLRAMGFLVSQHGQLGAIPSVSPLKSMRSGGAIPPPQKGYLSDTCAIPYENKANGCDTPLCDTISKGYCAIWGGISHWAAKPRNTTRCRFKFLS